MSALLSRSSFVRVSALLVAITCLANSPFTAKVVAQEEFTSEDWIEEIEKAFSQPEADLLPAAAIFPTVDETGEIGENGFAISLLANYLYEFCPTRKSHSSAAWYFRTWRLGGKYRKGLEISGDEIELYMDSLCADFYYFPQLEETEDGHELVIRRAIAGSQNREEVFRKDVPQDDYPSIPHLIATAIYDDQEAELSDDESKYLNTPQLEDREAMRQLQRLMSGYISKTEEAIDFLRKNPACTLAWILAFDIDSKDKTDLIEEFAKQREEFELEPAALLRADILPTPDAEKLKVIIGNLSEFKSNVDYMFALSEIIFVHSGTEVVDFYIDEWHAVADSYYELEALSRAVHNLGWMVRGTATVGLTHPEALRIFGERGKQAYEISQESIEVNPQGWQSHLIGIKFGTEIGEQEIARQHFDRLIEICPRCRAAWTSLFRAMQPRWGAETQDSLDFALKCIESDQWDQQIPPLAMSLLHDLADPAQIRGFMHSMFADERVWPIMQDYYASSQESDYLTEKAKNKIRNQYALYGAYGGHYEEVGQLFHDLRKNKEFDFKVFYDSATRYYLHDQIRANTSVGNEKLRAEIEIALCAGDLDEAESKLKALKEADAETGEYTEDFPQLEGGIALGRELLAKGEVTITPQQFKETFYHMSTRVSAVDDRIVIEVPEGNYLFLLSPFGFTNAVVSGDLKFDGVGDLDIIANSRANRDQVRILYDGSTSKVFCVRLYDHFIAVGDNKYSETSRFQILKTPQVDVLLVEGEAPWQQPAYEPSISGFGFYISPDEGVYTVEITNLKITLLATEEEPAE